MSGSSEGRWLHKGGELVAKGDSMAGRAGTSWRWGTVPQLPSKGDRAGLVPETRGRCSPRTAGQICGDYSSRQGSRSAQEHLQCSLGKGQGWGPELQCSPRWRRRGPMEANTRLSSLQICPRSLPYCSRDGPHLFQTDIFLFTPFHGYFS